MNITWNILLNLLTMINSLLAATICSAVLLLVVLFHRHSRSVPVLLACHTCLTLLISALLLASMTSASLFGFMGIDMYEHNNTIWCRWRGFLIHGCLCSLYDSYILQATYRLFHVVFYRHKRLHSYCLYCFLIPIEFLFGLLSISPVFLRNNVVYLPSEYYCQTPFTNLPSITYIAIRLFALPLIYIGLVYICILRHVRRAQASTTILYSSRKRNDRRRRNKNTRDLIVTRRLLVMLSVLILLGLPSIIFLGIFIVTGHLVPITYRIGWLSVSFSLVFLAYMLVQLTIPLRNTTIRLFQSIFSRYQSRNPPFEQVLLHTISR